jgi:hypothetical protein
MAERVEENVKETRVVAKMCEGKSGEGTEGREKKGLIF